MVFKHLKTWEQTGQIAPSSQINRVRFCDEHSTLIWMLAAHLSQLLCQLSQNFLIRCRVRCFLVDTLCKKMTKDMCALTEMELIQTHPKLFKKSWILQQFFIVCHRYDGTWNKGWALWSCWQDVFQMHSPLVLEKVKFDRRGIETMVYQDQDDIWWVLNYRGKLGVEYCGRCSSGTIINVWYRSFPKSELLSYWEVFWEQKFQCNKTTESAKKSIMYIFCKSLQNYINLYVQY
jgi:hypothetical protein